jgi:H+/Cl- antiporter ClcA
MKFEDKENHNLVILTGFSASFGGLFPTPVLGVLMIHELGQPPK